MGVNSLFTLTKMDILAEKGILTPEQLKEAKDYVEARQYET
jgi:hypothetical protein